MRLLSVATCNLNQWSMDFHSNTNRIKDSISKAKQAGAVIRLGPELEIPGCGCEDHFLELDTINHSWECLKDILVGDWTDGIVCSIGMPVVKDSERYNCQVLCFNRKIIMIRPKMWLANDGNYRELRWFTAWKQRDQLDDFHLPLHVSEALGQKSVPFGYGFVKFQDTAIAAEVCEELFTPCPPHAELALNGVEVFMNASGSHHQLRKLDVRLHAIISATRTSGGVYMYSNHQGCDGARLYYDGCASVVVNGDVVAQGSQFSLNDVEVMVAQIDLDVVTSLRGSLSSFQEQSSCKVKVPSVDVPYSLCRPFDLKIRLSVPLKIKYHSPEEEIAFGPACWLWDYLRRSGASGFLLPLSGGADSSAVTAIVGCMCQLVVKEIANGNEQIKADAIRIGNYKDGQYPTDSREFAKRILYTVFMGSENNSETTKSLAKVLADEVGSWHLGVSIDGLISSLLSLFKTLTGKQPRYKVDGGSEVENLSLQNIQAQIRMVIAYMLALLLPWVHNKPGFYLVLGSTNADEALCGYLTRYDCSSADINPIGSLCKQDIRAFLQWAAIHLGYSSLADIEAAPPTAELEPISSDYIQTDEVDLGMSYEELSVYGKLRKTFRCGPVFMFQNLCHKWGARLSPSQVAEKVKLFFTTYSINRYKMTTLTPSYHAESYSPEDNRFDLRQFLYNTSWPYQFRKIDELVHELDVKDVQNLGNHEKVAALSNGIGGIGVAVAALSNGVGGGVGVAAAGSVNSNV
ncbi:glutamine-dependent NAD(+) synthetase-like [Vicia villosa]|uniref:glutamine-dependent NAD(+) synthetase-like n=1 Tax=Vicia villosa TaxID=3911 RepID=UPI00273C260D|nr:glutamine-dependent NAD(+) synthetase-like [Vicia villosa]XP_058732151.1 glutamine-dependent NAD(+) synthetase-like [Vicia villosa]